MKESNGTPILEGLVECGPCGRTMLIVHDPEPRYACPVLLQKGPDDCPTPPVAVEELDEAAVNWLIRELLTESRINMITEGIITESDARKSPRQRDLEKTREELLQQERDRRAIMELVESGRATHQEAAGRLESLNNHRERLLEQADSARNDVQRWESIADRRGIHEIVMKPQTYLKTGIREFAQKLMTLMAERIAVGPQDITFRQGPAAPHPGQESQTPR